LSLPAGFGSGGDYKGGKGDKSLTLPLAETFRMAWADEDLRSRLIFVITVFAVYAAGVHVSTPVPGFNSAEVGEALDKLPFFQMLNAFGGGALRKLSVFALGLNPYITASIILQILQQAIPSWKKEMQEGGEYAKKKNNQRTRFLSIALCIGQGYGLLQAMSGVPSIAALPFGAKAMILVFWTAGSMFLLWLGEQISERGIGNGVSLMIFAGIILSLPFQAQHLYQGFKDGFVPIYSLIIVGVIFVAATWFIVYFTTAQRRIPIQNMRRQVGNRTIGGGTNYLPLSVNMAGVLPIIFAFSLVGMPAQFGTMLGTTSPVGGFLTELGHYLVPSESSPIPGLPFYVPKGFVGSILFTALIFFFTYFWTAIQYNVGDIADNLKKNGSFIPGIRPGKQTKDYLDGVISRITVVGALFIAAVALIQYITPSLAGISPAYISVIGGTSLLIMVSVALETMRQIEANLLMKQYGQ